MAPRDNPRDRDPGARGRFSFASGNGGYRYLGPAIILVLALLIGLYAIGGWIGNG